MLSESEVKERAQYCYCVLVQLGRLQCNEHAVPSRYLEYLKKSSLELGNDAFVVMTIEEALMQGRPDGGLAALIPLYEGFVHALCQVLETRPEDIMKEIPQEYLERLAAEVGLEDPLS